MQTDTATRWKSNLAAAAVAQFLCIVGWNASQHQLHLPRHAPRPLFDEVREREYNPNDEDTG